MFGGLPNVRAQGTKRLVVIVIFVGADFLIHRSQCGWSRRRETGASKDKGRLKAQVA